MECSYCTQIILGKAYTLTAFDHVSTGPKNVKKEHFCNAECANDYIEGERNGND